ncbi:protein kinase-like domain, concanavalin A-like lectin/glucanase domain protein [Tanacetum coccineum]
MGNKNHIRTLGDYSRPSHEGYQNTIELPDRNNVVLMRSDTIRLVQSGCSFHGLRSEDPNQHLKDFLKFVDSLDLDVAYRKRTRLLVPTTLSTAWKILSKILLNMHPCILTKREEDEAKEEGSEKSSVTEYKDHEMIVKSEEEFEGEIEEETKEEEEDNPEHFDAFPTMKELGYYEWLLKNPRPPWVKAKIRTENLNNVKFSCMIGHFDKKQAYLDVESPVNVMSRLHYNWIMSNRLEPRRKPSNLKKICNFVGRIRGLKVFIGNFTYECDFMVLKDTTSVLDHDLGSVLFGKPFVETTRLVYDMKEGTVVFEKDKEKIVFKMPHK